MLLLLLPVPGTTHHVRVCTHRCLIWQLLLLLQAALALPA
jgi:hypothetical protein